MALLTIHHLIYTRVEPEYSPASKNGFQTVYLSPEIASLAGAIEKRVQCFAPEASHTEQGTLEYQYFWLDTGQAVIAQTCAIASDAQVIDKTGRGGSFVAHALILAPEQFSRIRNDPFAVIQGILDAGIFTEDVETLVSYLRDKPPPTQVDVYPRTRFDESLEEWNAEALERWAGLVQSAGVLTRDKNSLLLLSNDSDDIYALLSAALFLMPKDVRLHCTFNTFVDGCIPAAGTYWAVGARKRQSASGFTTLNLSTRTIELRPQAAPKSSPYLMWLQQNLKSYIERSVGMTELYTAQIAAESLAAKGALPDEPLQETALATFREVNRDLYSAGLLTGLEAALGNPLGKTIAPDLEELVPLRYLMDAGAQEVIDPVRFAPSIYHWVLEHHATIRTWSPLLTFAQEADFLPLIVIAGIQADSGILARLRGHPSLKVSHQAIDRLVKNGQLEQWLDDFRSIVAETKLITAATASLIASSAQLADLEDELFVALAVALLAHDGRLLDSRYTRRVRTIQQKALLKRLAKALETANPIPADFAAAVRQGS